MLATENVQNCEAKVLVKSDGEPAIRKLVQVSASAARISDGVTVLIEQTPKGESKANGLAEGAVRDCKAKTRTLRCAVGKFLGVSIDHDHWSLPLRCKYAGAALRQEVEIADANGAVRRARHVASKRTAGLTIGVRMPLRHLFGHR